MKFPTREKPLTVQKTRGQEKKRQRQSRNGKRQKKRSSMQGDYGGEKATVDWGGEFYRKGRPAKGVEAGGGSGRNRTTTKVHVVVPETRSQKVEKTGRKGRKQNCRRCTGFINVERVVTGKRQNKRKKKKTVRSQTKKRRNECKGGRP